jgi:divalent metal cation (Fe/Co/Zn/Cd) transporter
VLVGSSLFLKAWLFAFYRHVGREIESGTIVAGAFDSLCDIAETAVVLGAVVAGGFCSFPVDGCAGVLAAVLVLFGGAKILRETISPLLGEPPKPEMVEELKSRLLQCDGIQGVHDIIIHNYGPNQYFATAHAEVDLNADILAVHDLLEKAQTEIGRTMPVHLLLHCDPCHRSGPRTREWQDKVENAAAEVNPLFKIYDFQAKRSPDGMVLEFSLLVPHSCSADQPEIEKQLAKAMQQYPSPPRLKITLVRSQGG